MEEQEEVHEEQFDREAPKFSLKGKIYRVLVTDVWQQQKKQSATRTLQSPQVVS